MAIDYKRKFQELSKNALWRKLEPRTRKLIRELSYLYRLTFQDFLKLVNMARDLEMWDEMSLPEWWSICRAEEKKVREQKNRASNTNADAGHSSGRLDKKSFLRRLNSWFEGIKEKEKVYPEKGPVWLRKRPVRIEIERSNKAIYGLCPVASPETLCCRLRTIDAVESCPYGCSYCSIRTFYGDRAVFDRDFAAKLASIPVDPDRFYRFGSGQSSDSLVWGNRYNVLGDLLEFAKSNPNALLELKTKSDRIDYLLENTCPDNLVCSWSLNTETIIHNEEHFTPSLPRRLQAARKLADRKVKVAFHFHPMVYYRGWEREYGELGQLVQDQFDAGEVLFVSYGSVTLIKPVIQALRMQGGKSRILQMPMASDPKGKITYPDDIKIALFSHMHDVFSPWHDSVYFYLCMEKRLIWEKVFGFAYENNEAFEEDFGRKTMPCL